jgi:hypothetical protein
MVADSEGSGVCVATSGLGAQKPRDVAGAAGSVAWEAHVCRLESDGLSGHATEVSKAECTWLVEESGQTFSSIS